MLPDRRSIDLRIGHFDSSRLPIIPNQWIGLLLSSLVSSKSEVTLSPNDLLNHALLDYRANERESKWQLQKGDQVVAINVIPKFFSNDIVVLRAAALRGHGIVHLPIFSASQEVIAGNLKSILSDWQTPKVDITAVYPSHKSLSPSMRTFINLVAESFQHMTKTTAIL